MNIVITAGGTQESIDEVRYITNMSTGQLGSEIADLLTDTWFLDKTLSRNHIFYIYVKGSVLPQFSSAISYIEVTDTKSVEKAINNVISENKINYFIHAMAISDYCVDNIFSMDDIINALVERSILDKSILVTSGETVREAINSITGMDQNSKISSNNDEMFISLKKTKKLIDTIKEQDPNIYLISFKLLSGVSTDKLIETAQKQLERTRSDIVIANDLKWIKDEQHKAYFVKENSITEVDSKRKIADKISEIINDKQMVSSK